MKLPRDLDGKTLAKLLKQYGYTITRQTGSHHVRLTSQEKGEHHALSSPLRVGTLNAVLTDIANHLKKPKDALIWELFK